MSLYLLQGAVEEGLIYALVALGLYISYQILGVADMTTDGGFVLGSAISAMLTVAGHPILGLVLGLLAGAGAGFITAFLQTALGIPSILAGIIMMTALYSINLMIQGGVSSFHFSGETTFFTRPTALLGDTFGVLVPMILLLTVIGLVLIFFFKTRIGLSVRATGDNPDMVQASSINPRFTITIGLCISNALVALGGALWAQKNHNTDLSSGVGVVVIGLASLVLGKLFFPKKKGIPIGIISAIIGSSVYRIIFTVALRYTSNVSYLKIISALLLTVIMAYPTVKAAVIRKRRHRKERTHVNPR